MSVREKECEHKMKRERDQWEREKSVHVGAHKIEIESLCNCQREREFGRKKEGTCKIERMREGKRQRLYDTRDIGDREREEE